MRLIKVEGELFASSPKGRESGGTFLSRLMSGEERAAHGGRHLTRGGDGSLFRGKSNTTHSQMFDQGLLHKQITPFVIPGSAATVESWRAFDGRVHMMWPLASIGVEPNRPEASYLSRKPQV